MGKGGYVRAVIIQNSSRRIEGKIKKSEGIHFVPAEVGRNIKGAVMGKLKNMGIEQEEAIGKGIKGKVDRILYIEGIDKAVGDSLTAIRVVDKEGNIVDYERGRNIKKVYNIGGHQPDGHTKLDISNPPQGGSGVKEK